MEKVSINIKVNLQLATFHLANHHIAKTMQGYLGQYMSGNWEYSRSQ